MRATVVAYHRSGRHWAVILAVAMSDAKRNSRPFWINL